MVGRCLQALAYVLTFPAAALVVDYIGAEFEDRGEHPWGEGWFYMLPAGLVVGGLALFLDARVIRLHWPWPTSWWRFLARSVGLHTIYLALAVGLATWVQLVFTSKASWAVALVGVLFLFLLSGPLPALALVFLTSPIGIVLGVVNAFVLRARAGHALGSAVLVGLVAIPVFWLPISAWHTRVRTFGWIERSLTELSAPPGSMRVYAEYKGCAQCATAGVTVLCVSDLPPREICEFYRARIPERLVIRKDADCTTTSSGAYALYASRTRSGVDASAEGIGLSIDESVREPTIVMSEAGRAEALRRARATGKRTIYALGVSYQEDERLTEQSRRCPC
jgi:hypothetical protein